MKMYTVSSHWTVWCTDSVYCKFAVHRFVNVQCLMHLQRSHAPPVCKFSALCNALAHRWWNIALLEYVGHAWAAPRFHNVRQRFIAVRKISAIRSFGTQKCVAGTQHFVGATLLWRKIADRSNILARQCSIAATYRERSHKRINARTASVSLAFPCTKCAKAYANTYGTVHTYMETHECELRHMI